MASETTIPRWVLRAVLIGFFGGALAFGTFSCAATAATQDSSDWVYVSPGEVGLIGAIFGAFGGAILGFLVWATAALVVLVRRAAKQVTAG